MERTEIDFNDRLELEDGTEGLDNYDHLLFKMIGGESPYFLSFCDGVSIILKRKVPKKIVEYKYNAPKTEFVKTFDSGIINLSNFDSYQSFLDFIVALLEKEATKDVHFYPDRIAQNLFYDLKKFGGLSLNIIYKG